MSSRAIGYLSVIAAGILWASSGTASKALFLEGITPFELVQARVTIAAVFLALCLWLFAKRLLSVRLQDLGYFLILGGVGLALVQVTYLYTISKMQVAAAILIQYTSPILVAAYSICFWAERLTVLKLIALLLALFGCYLVVGGYNLELLTLNREGAVTGSASAALFAMYSLLGERVMHRYQPWTVVFYALVFAADHMEHLSAAIPFSVCRLHLGAMDVHVVYSRFRHNHTFWSVLCRRKPYSVHSSYNNVHHRADLSRFHRFLLFGRNPGSTANIRR